MTDLVTQDALDAACSRCGSRDEVRYVPAWKLWACWFCTERLAEVELAGGDVTALEPAGEPAHEPLGLDISACTCAPRACSCEDYQGASRQEGGFLAARYGNLSAGGVRTYVIAGRPAELLEWARTAPAMYWGTGQNAVVYVYGLEDLVRDFRKPAVVVWTGTWEQREDLGEIRAWLSQQVTEESCRLLYPWSHPAHGIRHDLLLSMRVMQPSPLSLINITMS